MRKQIYNGFIEAMYWANDDELQGLPLAKSAADTLTNLSALFVAQNLGTLEALTRYGYSMEYIGGLLYFTLEGHGVGFWEKPEFKNLQTWLDNYYIDHTGRGIYSVDAYAGDDDLVYIAGLSIFHVGS